MCFAHFDVSNSFWETGVQKNVKNTPPLILGKYYSDCDVQGRLSIPSQGQYFKRFLTRVKTFSRPLAPDKLFLKTSQYLKNR